MKRERERGKIICRMIDPLEISRATYCRVFSMAIEKGYEISAHARGKTKPEPPSNSISHRVTYTARRCIGISLWILSQARRAHTDAIGYKPHNAKPLFASSRWFRAIQPAGFPGIFDARLKSRFSEPPFNEPERLTLLTAEQFSANAIAILALVLPLFPSIFRNTRRYINEFYRWFYFILFRQNLVFFSIDND